MTAGVILLIRCDSQTTYDEQCDTEHSAPVPVPDHAALRAYLATQGWRRDDATCDKLVAQPDTDDDRKPVVFLSTSGLNNGVYLPVDRVEEVVAGIRDAARTAARQTTEQDDTDAVDPTAAIEVWARLLNAADVHVYGPEHAQWRNLPPNLQDQYRKAAAWLLPRLTIQPPPAHAVGQPAEAHGTDRAVCACSHPQERHNSACAHCPCIGYAATWPLRTTSTVEDQR